MQKIQAKIEDRLDVYIGEVALHFRVSEQHVRTWFKRGYILAIGDFNLVRKVGKLWRGSRSQWNAIKELSTKN